MLLHDSGYNSLNTIIYQINTLRQGVSEVPLYLQEPGRDISDYFNPDKVSELPDLRDIKYSININGLIPYSPLYNLSEVQLEVLYLYL